MNSEQPLSARLRKLAEDKPATWDGEVAPALVEAAHEVERLRKTAQAVVEARGDECFFSGDSCSGYGTCDRTCHEKTTKAIWALEGILNAS